VLDFGQKGNLPVIRGDYSRGRFLRFVNPPENPSLRFPYFETSVELRPGSSGGPVFDLLGRIIGVNCRGWDFRGGEHAGDPLSYITPIRNILDLAVDTLMAPPFSWEAQQVPQSRRGQLLKVWELAKYGHILFDPPLN
jgi:hypothetical protein